MIFIHLEVPVSQFIYLLCFIFVEKFENSNIGFQHECLYLIHCLFGLGYLDPSKPLELCLLVFDYFYFDLYLAALIWQISNVISHDRITNTHPWFRSFTSKATQIDQLL